ncbi:hypothetical protein VNI00_013483 [Paramarasmius palmivorus]|uniref:F-box domain-containing protein n=1 Tax=Paramarasmius palmivorus TaxID=297713 RepID=A0AAW0C117_9AGAR
MPEGEPPLPSCLKSRLRRYAITCQCSEEATPSSFPTTRQQRKHTENFPANLPSELWAEIFIWLSKTCPLWEGICNVSKHFQVIALGTPCLWTRPDLTRPWSTRRSLKQSKAANLTISVTKSQAEKAEYEKNIARSLDMVLTHCASRIEELDVSFSPGTAPLLGRITHSAPELRRLRLRCSTHNVPSNFCAGDALRLPSMFLNGRTPLLESVDITLPLHYDWFSALAPLFPSLRSLSLAACSISQVACTTFHPSLKAFLESCSTATRLEELSLDGCLPQVSETRVNGIQLKRLTKLKLSSSTLRECVNFCHRIQADHLACAIIFTREYESDARDHENHFWDLLKALPTALVLAGCEELHMKFNTDSHRGSFHLDFAAVGPSLTTNIDADPARHGKLEPQSILHVQCKWLEMTNYDMDIPAMAQNFLSFITGPSITCLRLDLDSIPPTLFNMVAWTNVRSLYVVGPSGLDAITLLDPNQSRTGALIMPSLKVLHLDMVDLKVIADGRALNNTVCMRQHHGSFLDRLVLGYGCFNGSDQVLSRVNKMLTCEVRRDLKPTVWPRPWLLQTNI